MLNYSHPRSRATTVMRSRAPDPRTSASRRAGCVAHKSGSVRGAPVATGGPYSAGGHRAQPAQPARTDGGVGITQKKYRVAPGRCLPGAPTDPDVRISRIRFVKSRFRCGEQG
jgi:hypothetical protein